MEYINKRNPRIITLKELQALEILEYALMTMDLDRFLENE